MQSPQQRVAAPAPPAVSQQPPALAPGTLLVGRYLIHGHIGGGGFAHIYDAQDTVLGHRRAIKEAFYRDAQTQQQFQLEAEFLLNARHANLVRGYAVFADAGRFYLVMDYVDGQTVEEIAIQHIRQTGRPLGEAQVLDWIIPICDALHELHQQPTPIIHRDVKPANIKITHRGAPVLIDLGLAKLYAQGQRTIGAALAFTPGYAPPEQYQASGATDQRTDVYGLGATLYFLLTGYQPVEAPARISAHALPAPRTLNPAITVATEAVVLEAMALDPRARQQRALILKDGLVAARGALDAPAGQAVIAGPGNPNTFPVTPTHANGATALAMPAPAILPPQGAPAPGHQPVARLADWVGAVSREVHARTAAQPGEAQTTLAIMLSLVTFSLSALAVIWGWMLLWVVPALALAAFGLRRQMHQPREQRLREFWLLAWVSVCLSCAWPLLWLIVYWAAHRP
ncbi:MAG: hypothetical protein OJF49_000718 [Ktedonobacterales bacterium]|nr:MAG: hypothetical protein OJF49_000718 [Ktedonobacterales bacterium]